MAMALEPSELQIKNLIMDSEGCSLATIQSILNLDESIHPKWAKLAHGLGISRERIQNVRDDLAANKIRSSEMCSEILAIWAEDNGPVATLGVLIQTLVMVSESIPPCVGQLLHLVTHLDFEEMSQRDLNWKDEESNNTLLHLVPSFANFAELDVENIKMGSSSSDLDERQIPSSTCQLVVGDIKLLVQVEFIKFLVNHGVDPNAKNNEKNTTTIKKFVIRMKQFTQAYLKLPLSSLSTP